MFRITSTFVRGFIHQENPIISAACFKISFSIASLWFSLRKFNNSFCSGVRLSFTSNDPEALCWRTHLSKADGVSSYSLIISPLGLPEARSRTTCSLNSFVNVLLFLPVITDSPPTHVESSLYDLNESV